MSYKVSEIKIVYKPKKGKRPQVKCSKDAFEILTEIYDWNTIEAFETFWILLLNRNNRVIGAHKVSEGSTVGTLVDSKLIFSVALKSLCCSVILSHNHPSNNLEASKSDIDLTKKLVEAGKVLDIYVLDHLIVTPSNGFMSFADYGLM